MRHNALWDPLKPPGFSLAPWERMQMMHANVLALVISVLPLKVFLFQSSWGLIFTSLVKTTSSLLILSKLETLVGTHSVSVRSLTFSTKFLKKEKLLAELAIFIQSRKLLIVIIMQKELKIIDIFLAMHN